MIQIFSGRFTRAGRAVRPDPTVDHIMAMVQDDLSPDEIEKRLAEGLPLPNNKLEETTGLVTLMVPSDDGPLGDLPLDLTLNGVRYSLQRNTMATIPKELAALIMHSSNIKTLAPLTGRNERVQVRYDFDTGHHEGMTLQDQSRFKVHIEQEE